MSIATTTRKLSRHPYAPWVAVGAALAAVVGVMAYESKSANAAPNPPGPGPQNPVWQKVQPVLMSDGTLRASLPPNATVAFTMPGNDANAGPFVSNNAASSLFGAWQAWPGGQALPPGVPAGSNAWTAVVGSQGIMVQLPDTATQAFVMTGVSG